MGLIDAAGWRTWASTPQVQETAKLVGLLGELPHTTYTQTRHCVEPSTALFLYDAY